MGDQEQPLEAQAISQSKVLPGWSGTARPAQPNLSEIPLLSDQRDAAPLRVADALVDAFAALGVRRAYGVSGGAMATLWEALTQSEIDVLHFRHEAGAGFAAIEAHFVAEEPILLFTTAGPGITNALTAALAARSEGAKLIMVSACTPAAQRGRFGTQETHWETLPGAGVFSAGPLFHYAALLENPEQLPQVVRTLAAGLARTGGFVAHLSLPTKFQTEAAVPLRVSEGFAHVSATANDRVLDDVAALLDGEPFAIWAGFGARHASEALRAVAERSGAPVFCTPRGKGVFPERHPQFVGVSGLGGHAEVAKALEQHSAARVLVLGTRLHESSSFWSRQFAPSGGFIHVDVDASVPGVAYPDVPTLAVQAEVGDFLTRLIDRIPEPQNQNYDFPNPRLLEVEPTKLDAVRPEALMTAIQRTIVDGSDAIVIAESGNSFIWTNHHLRFDRPGRYRVSTQVGSMGHAVTGVVGAAEARGGKAVAITGDGSMLMNNEISTAVRFGIPAVWIVLNDGYYNMCRQGMASLRLRPADATLPATDFVMVARGLGAKGARVESEIELKSALEVAVAATEPFVVDVRIDPEAQAPSHGRNERLAAESRSSN